MRKLSGFMLVQSKDLIKHTKRLQEDLNCRGGTTPKSIHFVWSPNGSMRPKMGTG